MLIFLHISKTGGSTLTPVIDWNYKQETYKITKHVNNQIFIDLPDADKLRYRALSGQVFYGIHQYIPEPCKYVTILRHPIKRLVSHFEYINVRREKLGEKIVEMSMEEFLEQEPFHAYTQLALISGGDTMDEALKSPIADDDFEKAKANIEKDFPVVGLVEKYDESLILMKHHFNWQRAFYKRTNVNHNRRRFEDFPVDTRKLIQAVCEPEMELYDYVQRRLDAQLSQQPPSFLAEVKQLKRDNQRFSKLYDLASPLQQTPLWNATKWVLQNLGNKS